MSMDYYIDCKKHKKAIYIGKGDITANDNDSLIWFLQIHGGCHPVVINFNDVDAEHVSSFDKDFKEHNDTTQS